MAESGLGFMSAICHEVFVLLAAGIKGSVGLSRVQFVDRDAPFLLQQVQ